MGPWGFRRGIYTTWCSNSERVAGWIAPVVFVYFLCGNVKFLSQGSL